MDFQESTACPVLLCLGAPRCASVCPGVPRCASVCLGVSRCVPVCLGASRCASVCDLGVRRARAWRQAGPPRRTLCRLAYVGPHWESTGKRAWPLVGDAPQLAFMLHLYCIFPIIYVFVLILGGPSGRNGGREIERNGAARNRAKCARGAGRSRASGFRRLARRAARGNGLGEVQHASGAVGKLQHVK